MTRERPIIMSGESVLAILSGTKTQTRRVYKPRAPGPCEGMAESDDGRPWPFWWDPNQGPEYYPVRCPYGEPGDRLWVRETWRIDDSGVYDSMTSMFIYRADEDMPQLKGSWKSPIFMPRAASRLTLEISDVRMQRLQDISDEDARREGLDWAAPQYLPHDDEGPDEDPREVGYSNGGSFARDNFQRLWQMVNGKRAPWASNPWVWALAFRRVS